MNYLLAHCPMLGCNHRNLICSVPAEGTPEFEPSVYIAVKCTNCGQVFRELAIRLELSATPAGKARRREDRK